MHLNPINNNNNKKIDAHSVDKKIDVYNFGSEDEKKKTTTARINNTK